MKNFRSQKSCKMKKKELRAKRAAIIERAEKDKTPPKIFILSQKVRNMSVAIEAAFNGEKFPYSERKIQNVIQATHGHPDTAFLKRIFLYFANLKIEFTDKKSTYAATGSDPIDILTNLARYQGDVIREVETWKPSSHNLQKQVYSFARHLFVKYHIPSFMDTAWHGGLNSQYMTWFIQIGQGYNIRTVNGLPIPLTKKEAHLTMEAPKDFTIPQAIRYGQVLNLGGDERLVRQILRTRIGVNFENNEFWVSVFRWLLLHPMLDVAHYAPVVDYIFNQKFVPYRMDTTGHMICAQPNLSMKGRDPETLLKQVEAWHKQLGKEKKGSFSQWASSGINGFYSKNDRENVIRMIQEICTQKELINEGRTMKHCAGSYAGSCAQGRISIWKFEEMSAGGIEKRLTIELDNRTRNIVQARGKYNAIATASDKYWLNQWAREARLGVSRYMI